METERRIIGIARHGLTPNNADGISLDSLTNESVQRMYEQGLDSDFQADRAFVLHSEKNRTVSTAEARLAGIRKLSPKPLTQEDLQRFDFNGTLFIMDDRLSYESLQINWDALKRIGLPTYLDSVIEDKNATEMEGIPVTSFQQVYDTRRPVLGDALRRMEAANYDFGFILTHGPIAEAINMAAVDSSRDVPVNRYEDIGGQFKKEDIAYLVMDTKEKSGATDGRIVRGDLVLPVNLEKIRREY